MTDELPNRMSKSKDADAWKDRIAILITCHNRREQTLACLARLKDAKLPPDVLQEIWILDDGSTDGTGEAISQHFPEVKLETGDGSCFWCGGMRRIWAAAATGDPAYYLLLNDDTLLDNDALMELMAMLGEPDKRCIAVAAIRDPDTGARTYGGIRGQNCSVSVSGNTEPCDTFNANAALIPRSVFRELGVFHSAYTHAMGDFDYGYEANRRGIRVLQSSRTLGTCRRNSSNGTWKDRSLRRRERLRRLQSPKGLPWREWVTYNRRNSGWLWPWRCVTPFIRILLGR